MAMAAIRADIAQRQMTISALAEQMSWFVNNLKEDQIDTANATEEPLASTSPATLLSRNNGRNVSWGVLRGARLDDNVADNMDGWQTCLGLFCEQAGRRHGKRCSFEELWPIFDHLTKKLWLSYFGNVGDLGMSPNASNQRSPISCPGLNEQLHYSILPLDALLMELAERT